MKNVITLIFVNILLILLQDSFLANLLPSEMIPTLLLALSFGFILSDREDLSYLSAFIGGLLNDLLNFNIVGESSLILVVCIFLFSLFRRYVSKNLFSSFLGIFVTNTIFIILTYSIDSKNLDFFLINGALTFSISIILYFLIEWLTNSIRKSTYSIKR